MSLPDPFSRVYALDALVALREEAAADGRVVVLTNGCFDCLHLGHAACLEQSASFGDLLFVAVNSDASTRDLKGPQRPFNGEKDRAALVAALRCVDAAFVFPGPRLDAEIRHLRPDVYTKGGDYRIETLDPAERAALEDAGAEIRILHFLEGRSTTSIIRRATL